MLVGRGPPTPRPPAGYWPSVQRSAVLYIGFRTELKTPRETTREYEELVIIETLLA
jgi:hypothetical protein